jgi:hypothetical protein
MLMLMCCCCCDADDEMLLMCCRLQQVLLDVGLAVVMGRDGRCRADTLHTPTWAVPC